MSTTEEKAPRWWHCDTHGPGNATAWGCPECVREMRAELAEWRKLRDPVNLHVNLLRGMPAKMTPEQIWHLVADDRDRLADLEAETVALREEIQQLHLAEDGAKTAFAHVVESKRSLEGEIAKLRADLQAAHDIIRRNSRAQQELR